MLGYNRLIKESGMAIFAYDGLDEVRDRHFQLLCGQHA